MIRINLLPLELRQHERTPAPRLYTMYAGVALTMGAIAIGTVIYGKIKVLESEITNLEGRKTVAQAAVAEYDQIKMERDRYQARKNAVTNIQARRKFRWSRQLDTLADVVDLLPKLWLTTIKFGDGTPSGLNLKKADGRSVEFYMEMKDANTATAEKDLYREVEKVLTAKFIDSAAFQKLVDPEKIVLEKQEKYVEQWSHKFAILLLGLGTPKVTGPPGLPGGS